jgi:hypothetical protein
MSASVHLDDASVHAVAERVAELLRSGPLVCELIDTAEVARRFSLSRDYVYEHADDLGAVRLGSGPKARLRFDPAKVTERLDVRNQGQSPHKGTPVHPVRKGSDVTLLPFRGESQ